MIILYIFIITIFSYLSTKSLQSNIYYMLDIKQEIQVLLLRQGLSMSKMTRAMKDKNLINTNIASLSRMLSTKTIKFETVQLILDYLGYELDIKRKLN